MRSSLLTCAFTIVTLFVFSSSVYSEQVVYYSFDKLLTDQVEDLSGLGNHGLLEDEPLIIDGYFKDALQFDGNRVAMTPTDTLTAEFFQSSFTIAAWINPTRTGNTWQHVFRAMAERGNDTLFINSNGMLSWRGRVDGNWAGGMCETAAGAVPAEQWTHIAIVGDETNFRMYINGRLAQESAYQMTQGGNITYYIGGDPATTSESYSGAVDDFTIYSHALEESDIQSIMLGLGNKGLASQEQPEDGDEDVVRAVELRWTPGKYAAKHIVYLSQNYDEVNDAHETALVEDNLDVNSLDVGLLEYGKTYYWRVDEVNALPDSAIYTGDVWSFTVETYASPIVNISATTSSELPGKGAENTINGSGLNDQGQHSTLLTDMWMAQGTDVWIQYDFDKVYKLHELFVWNCNYAFEPVVSFGIKEVLIETSVDGETWIAFDNATQINKASGLPTNEVDSIVDLSGIMAKHVKLTVISKHGTSGQMSLAEVRFTALPTSAREPKPADGETLSTVHASLKWRPGREVAEHEIWMGTEPTDLKLVKTVDTTSAQIGPLDYSTTYYWSIIEVNEAEIPTSHASEIWSFNTADFGVVEDFENYSGEAGKEVFMTWLDGYGGDRSLGGSMAGHWDTPYVESDLVYSGQQSLPLYIDNNGSFTDVDGIASSPNFSEIKREFTPAQDWTTSHVKTLSIMFRGNPGVTGQLYCMINNARVNYDGEQSNLSLAAWQAWHIDLASVSTQLNNIHRLSIGVEGGGEGILYIDAIRLYPHKAELIVPMEPGSSNLVSHYAFEGDLKDSTGNHDGVTFGSPSFETDSIRGQVLWLNGQKNAVDIPYSSELNPPAFTVSLWMNVDPSATGYRSPLTSRDNGPQKGYMLYLTPGNRLEYWTGPGWHAVTGPVVEMETWIHVVMTFENDHKQLFVNGLLVGEGDSAMDLNTDQVLRIGGGETEGDGDFFFAGMIDDVQIYNQAISYGEVLWLAGAKAHMYKPF